MVDEVTRLSEHRHKHRPRSDGGSADVVGIFDPLQKRESQGSSSHISRTELPKYPDFVPEKETQGSPRTTANERAVAVANLHNARSRMVQIRERLIKQSDGGSRLIPELQEVIDTMERDLKILGE